MKRSLLALAILSLLACFAACGNSEPPLQMNPGKSLRIAYVAAMQVYAGQLSQIQNVRGSLPEGDGVQVLISHGITAVPTTDAFGTELRYHNDGTHWTLSSAGPDLKWGTPDDIVIEDGQLK
jgi:hypothetical protein